MKIGFPLSQTCILFTSLWGIFYFKEISIQPIRVRVKFIFGIFFLIFGAYILAAYG